MSLADKKGINLSDGFKLVAEKPLDARQVVAIEDDKADLVASNAAYAGLIVYVEATKKSYVYNGTDWELLTTGTAYTHPTGDGNMHVPATGTTHNGYILVAGATAGSFAWKRGTPSDVGAAAASHTHTKADITDLVIPTKLPNPNGLTITALDESGDPQPNTYDGSKALTINATPEGLSAADRVHTHTKADITDFPASLKNPAALTLSLNGVAQDSYDGSVAKSVNISPKTVGAAAASHTHTKADITDFPDTSKTQNPLKVYLGSASATPSIFNGEQEVSVVISPTAISAADRVHTHAADDISGLPTVLPNPQSLSISLNGGNTSTYDGNEKVAIDITPAIIGASASDHTHPYAGSTVAGGAAKSVANSLKISLNGGGTEGVSYFTYDGSAEKSMNITPSAIGAATSDHEHNYAGSKTPGGVATEAAKTTGSFEVSLNNVSAGSFNGSKDLDINITPSAIGAAAANHTHSYAGSASVGGPATSAQKWTSERTVTLAGDVSGKATVDGSKDVSIDVSIKTVAASAINGVISIDNIPKSAVERCVVVADDTARFALTTNDVQKGDTVKVTNTNLMYFVVDDTKLNVEEGYESYSAGQASSVPWSGVTGKPAEFTPAAHNHVKAEITDFPESMKNPNALSITLGETGTASSYDGSATKSIKIAPSTIGAAPADHTHLYAGAAVEGGAANSALSAEQVEHSISISLNGNNNQTFDGSEDVTIDITPDSIGAADHDHTHPYAGSKTANGPANSVANTFTIALNGGAKEGTNLFTYDGSAAKTLNINPANIGAAAASHTHTADNITGLPTALKTPSALTISLNGANQGAWDGSAAKSINITPTSIGAAATNHTHNYAGSDAAGGAANSVAHALAINLNGGTTEGTDKFTFDGSAAKVLNIDALSVGASPKDHTHKYAGSATVGGAATSADKVNHLLTINMRGPGVMTLDDGSMTGTASTKGVFNGLSNVILDLNPVTIGAAAENHTHNYAGSSSAGGAATSANKVPVPVGTVMFSMSSTTTFFSNCFGGTWEVVGNLDATINGEGGTEITLYMFKKIND